MIEVTGEGARFWPRWRGPSGQGFVAPGKYANTWSPTTNVKWRVPMPGAGNSSPIVWGDRIYPDDRAGGRQQAVAAGVQSRRRPQAVGDVCSAGRRRARAPEERSRLGDAGRPTGSVIYASFGRHGLVAFDLNGKIVWHRKFGVIDNYHGPAGSPVLYKDRVFLYQDHDGSQRAARVRRRLRRQDRQDAVGDAADRNRGLGHAGRHQHRRARRAGRQQPAARRGVRSRRRAGSCGRCAA